MTSPPSCSYHYAIDDVNAVWNDGLSPAGRCQSDGSTERTVPILYRRDWLHSASHNGPIHPATTAYTCTGKACVHARV